MLKLNSWLFLFFSISLHLSAVDPLPSWNDGQSKQRILNYVKEVTDEKNAKFIPIEERLATFDQDGTLWVEQPIYTQFMYAIDAIRSMGAEHPEWKDSEPFKAILSNDLAAIKHSTLQEIEKMLAVTHAGMSIEEYHEKVKKWLSHAVHPRFNKPYTELIYLPMAELVKYLKDNQFKVYIVSGGGQEFIRVYAEKIYGIPPEQVIGTAGKVQYEYRKGKPILMKLPEVLYIDDKEGKPEAINLIIGRRPVAAFGNSIGDQQMLEWAQGGKKTNLELLVHHDDPVREYAYGPKSRVGTFSDALMQEALKEDWIVVSMKNDWKVIFPYENRNN